MLNESDRARIARLASENSEAAYIIHLLEEERRELLSMVSHEIRNPLTLINSTLQLIENAHPETRDFRFWSQIKEDVLSLRLLLDDLSIYNNATFLNCVNLDLCKLTRQVVHTFLPELEQRRILLKFSASGFPNLESELEPEVPIIFGDPVKLRQVLVNLIKNAMEALEGRKDGIIHIHLLPAEHTVALQIQDNGCGIPAEHLEDIFLPFRTYKPQGTGLGLPLSLAIAQAHNGTLSVTSAKDLGTVFTLTLPRAVIT